MAFTNDLATDIGQVRLEIGDRDATPGNGVQPDGTNFSDEEIQVWLTREGTVGRAAAAACEALARIWARAVDTRSGPLSQSYSQVSERYALQAKQLRERYGGDGCAFSTGFARNDGFAMNDANTNDYS